MPHSPSPRCFATLREAQEAYDQLLAKTEQSVPANAETGADSSVEDLLSSPSAKRQTRHHQRLELVGRIAGGVSHELNNPIQAACNYAELIAGMSKDSEVAEFAGHILEETERIARTMHWLLDFASPQTDSVMGRNLGDAIQAAVGLLKTPLRRSGIEPELLLANAPELPRLNHRELQQLLISLLMDCQRRLEPLAGRDKSVKIWLTQPAPESWAVIIEDSSTQSASERLAASSPSLENRELLEGIAADHGGSLIGEVRPTGHRWTVTFR